MVNVLPATSDIDIENIGEAQRVDSHLEWYGFEIDAENIEEPFQEDFHVEFHGSRPLIPVLHSQG